MANIMRYDPFRELISLRDAMNSLFEDSFVVSRGADGNGVGMTGQMPIDLIEDKDKIVLKATLPGVKPEDIDIQMVGDSIQIEAESHDESEVKEGNYVRRERRYGKYMRTIPLPTSVQADKVDANYEHGVLTLTLPKAEEVKPKQIKVGAKQIESR